MGILDMVTGRSSVTTTATEAERLREQLRGEQEQNLHLLEAMSDLELMLEDQGWESLTGELTGELSRRALIRASNICRVAAVGNPLIKRGLGVRQAYVFGQGVDLKARNDTVEEIVHQFWTDKSNQRSLSGSQAQEELERALGTDGNVFLAHFTTPKTGRVEVRSFPFSEITDIILNPEDRDEPWYYERSWVETEFDSDGTTRMRERKVYYPDINYRPAPARRFKRINGYDVNWNAPIYHISVNRLDGWKFGIGDAFAAVAWARAFKEFLEDWAVLVKALSRFAWRGKSKRKSAAQSMRDKFARTSDIDPNTGRTKVGSTAIMDDDTTLEAIPKTGAVIDSDSGKPLAAMVAAALEISLVVLLTDPGSTGARAVAETLDEPTIRMAEKRQKLWSDAYKASINYRLDMAVRAGRLPGNETFDPEIRRFRTEISVDNLDDDEARLLDIDWPDLGADSVKDRIESIVKAGDAIPGEIQMRLLLIALGVENVEEIVSKYLDADGNFIDPNASATMDAVNRFRRGEPDSDAVNRPPAEDENEEDEE